MHSERKFYWFFFPTKKDRSQNSLKLWCNLDLYKFIALEMSNLWKAGYTFTQDLTTKYGPFYNEIHMNLKYHETWHPQNLFLMKNSSLRVLSLKNLYISNLTLVLTLRTMTYEEEQSGFFFCTNYGIGQSIKAQKWLWES